MKKKLVGSTVLVLGIGFAGLGVCGGQTDLPGVVVYQAKNGNVTFDHAAHAKSLECAKCHQTDPPQKIEITRETAHAGACAECHKQMQAGPTKCAECHVK